MNGSQHRKRIPYGVMNFERLRSENSYYVDKTMYIPRIEQGHPFFFFIRPRRFGKSLLLSMLRSYYDVKKRDCFDRLFGDLWIGRHPTVSRNSYLVLSLNFSLFGADLDNYCFSTLSLPSVGETVTDKDGAEETSLFNSDMVLYFVSAYLESNGRFPEQMIDRNICTDYNKLRMLIRKDATMKAEGSVIQHLLDRGSITSTIVDSFPAEAITSRENFVSLLYYFGMLTIGCVKRGKAVLIIPNFTVREQLYKYMEEVFRDIAHCEEIENQRDTTI